MPGSCCSRHGSHVAQEIQWTAGHVQWLRTTVQELDDRDLVRGTTRTETETAGALRIDPDSDGAVDDVGAAPSNASTSSPSPRPRSRPADQVDVPDSRDREGYTVWRTVAAISHRYKDGERRLAALTALATRSGRGCDMADACPPGPKP